MFLSTALQYVRHESPSSLDHTLVSWYSTAVDRLKPLAYPPASADHLHDHRASQQNALGRSVAAPGPRNVHFTKYVGVQQKQAGSGKFIFIRKLALPQLNCNIVHSPQHHVRVHGDMITLQLRVTCEVSTGFLALRLTVTLTLVGERPTVSSLASSLCRS